MSGSGNGVDIGSVYQLLLRVAETVDGLRVILDDHTRIHNQHSGGQSTSIPDHLTNCRTPPTSTVTS